MSFFSELQRRNVFRVGIAYGVAAWLLIQIADTVFPRIGLADSAVTLVIALLGIGFLPALIFAWAFELTPEGLKRESAVDRSNSITPQTGKKLDRVIILGLLAVIAVMAIERYWFAGRGEAEAEPGRVAAEPAVVEQAKTIAVLPFADLSQNQDQAWFSDGLAEEILNALARAPDLLVSSRTSSFAYKGSQVPISQIADELGVQHILEGSVRRAGDRIRVTAQLIRAADGFHVWSENYDREAGDIIAVQEELAVNIARALKTTMDPDALERMLGAGTRSVEAYEHYLNGLSLSARAWEEPGWDSYLLGYEEFEQAREIDPGFSSAHYRAALFWYDQVSISRRPSGLVSVSPSEKMSAFRERIAQAIESSRDPVARMKFEALLARVETRFRDAIGLSLQVLEARPFDFANVEILLEVAQDADDLDTQLKAFRHAHELWRNGPDWLRASISAAWRLTFSGGDTGIDVADWIYRAATQSGKPSPAYQAHRALLWFGETARAADILPLLTGESEAGRALVDARQACAEGRRSDAERILANLQTDWKPERKASTAWHLHQLLGRPDRAAAVLKPFESTDAPLTVASFLGYPDFDPAPFPVVLSVMQREGINRSSPVAIPFACPEQDAVQRQSVAVLPFTSMSSGADDGYFADGLTEEILNALAGLPELLVTARTSSFHFKGRDLPIPEIARTLGVAHVVEGSVRRAGERVRITAQLVRAEDGFHLWSDTYDRTLEDVFAVQEDIATNIAETLDVVLNDDKRRAMRDAGIGDVKAFIAHQKGMEAYDRAHRQERQIEALTEANRWFDEALAIVPDIGNALYLRTDLFGHVLFAHATNLQSYEPAELENALVEIRSSLARAIRAARNDALRAILEVELALFSEDWTRVTEYLDQAFELGHCNPTNWVAEFASPHGYAARVAALQEERARCDPMSGWAVVSGTAAMVWNSDAQRGVQATERFMERAGFHPWVDDMHFIASLAAGLGDRPGLDKPAAEGSNLGVPRSVWIHALDNDIEAARSIYDKYVAGHEVSDVDKLCAEAIMGNRDGANALAAAIDSRPGGSLALSTTVQNCYSGAPFDLEAAPTYKARLEEAGFAWPPASSPIDFPAKDW